MRVSRIMAFPIIAIGFASVPKPAMAITYQDVENCAVVVGKFGNVIPVVQFIWVGAQYAGIAPDKEKEFRERLETQNAQIRAGIANLNDGLKEISKSLESLNASVNDLPGKLRGSDLYLGTYPILKRVTRNKLVPPEDLAEIKRDLQKILDQAEAASTLAPAELYYFSAVNLMVVALAKVYEVERGGAPAMPAASRDYYVNNTKHVDSLLAHCQSSYSLLKHEKQLQTEYDEQVATIDAHLLRNGMTAIFEETEGNAKKWTPFAFKKEDYEAVKETRRLVIIRTEKPKKPELRVTRKNYAFEVGSVRQIERLATANGFDIKIYRDLEVKNIKEFTSETIAQLAPGVSYEAKLVSIPIDEHLTKVVNEYNGLSSVALATAYKVVLVRGLHNWLDQSAKELSSLRKSCSEKLVKK
jgi:hypothetical protein